MPKRGGFQGLLPTPCRRGTCGRLIGSGGRIRTPRSRSTSPILASMFRAGSTAGSVAFPPPRLRELRDFGEGPPGIHREEDYWWILCDPRGRVIGGARVNTDEDPS
jgi:hypothetical protein